MRIAFDVMGTLKGPKGEFLIEVLKELKARDHECVVWSNSIGFASSAVRDYALGVEYSDKRMKSDVEIDDWFDVAFEDDHSQTWLASRLLIFVDEVDNSRDVKEFVDSIEGLSL